MLINKASILFLFQDMVQVVVGVGVYGNSAPFSTLGSSIVGDKLAPSRAYKQHCTRMQKHSFCNFGCQGDPIGFFGGGEALTAATFTREEAVHIMCVQRPHKNDVIHFQTIVRCISKDLQGCCSSKWCQ